MRRGQAFETLKLRWVIRHPNGRSQQTSRLPGLVECGVCGNPTALTGETGRIVCSPCGAHVVTVIDREQGPS